MVAERRFYLRPAARDSFAASVSAAGGKAGANANERRFGGRSFLPPGRGREGCEPRVMPRPKREGGRSTTSRSITGRFYHAHPGADWPAAEWRPGGRVASGRRHRDVPPVVVSPRRRLSRDGGGECRRCRGARVAPITVRMEQLAQFVSKSFDNAAAAVAAATSVETAAGCRAAAGRITLSVAHLIGDHVANDGDRRTCNYLFPMHRDNTDLFRYRVAWGPIGEIGGIDAQCARFSMR